MQEQSLQIKEMFACLKRVDVIVLIQYYAFADRSQDEEDQEHDDAKDG